MTNCESVEVSSLADTNGEACSRTAKHQCSDCGICLCDVHTETCDICHEILCSSCLSFHEKGHSKPATREPKRERKTA